MNATVNQQYAAVPQAMTQPAQPDTALHYAEQLEKAAEFLCGRLGQVSSFIQPSPPDATGTNAPQPSGLIATLDRALSSLNRAAGLAGEIDRKLGL